MAAVVGPVGVHHPDLGDGGVPALVVPEVGLEEFQVIQVHGQAQLLQQGGEPRLVQGGEAGQGLHHGRGGVVPGQGLRLLQGGLPALHRVDEVAPDLVQLLLAQPALQQVDLGVADPGPLHPGHELDALRAGVGALVELARQGLHRQQAVGVPGLGEGLVPDHVGLGLGEDHGLGPLVDLGVDVLHVVAVEDPDPRQGADAQEVPQVRQKAARLGAQPRAFFHIDPVYHHLPPSSARRARRPISRRQ